MIQRSSPISATLSLQRLSRLHRLATLMVAGPVAKEKLLATLKIGLRTFYRDVTSLQEFGLEVVRDANGYFLAATPDDIERQLPFPDPKMNFAEARQLALFHNPVAERIAAQLTQIFAERRA